MNYQSLKFIFFAGIVLLAYYSVKRKYQKHVLLLANTAFYVFAGIKYLPFIGIAALSAYWTGKKIGRIYRAADIRIKECADAAQKKQMRAHSKAESKRILLFGMGVIIGLMAVCKYTGFLLENLNFVLLGVGIPQIPTFKMILPLGISFYSFMALSYMLDVYWKRYEAEESFLNFAVYLSYFPHVVQGPIDRFNEFHAQIKNGIAFSYQNLTFGAQLMLWGLFKKLVLADRLGIFVDVVFKKWDQFDGIVLIFAVVVYSFQIYSDFSGCIDIVTGVSEMFGIRLRDNFRHPYFSRTMGEFWRRWHISLQEWFKDYVYFPVSSSALIHKSKKYFKEKGKKRISELFAACFPIFVVWLITGIWHGAAWKFVAWGVFHAILLIGSKVFEPVFASVNHSLRINADCWPWRLWQIFRTFFLCCAGRIFFRAENLQTAFAMIPKMLRAELSIHAFWNQPTTFDGMTPEHMIISAAAILVLLIVDIVQEKIHIRETLARSNIVLRWILIYGCLFAVLLFGIYGPGYGASGFIYEQF